MAPKIKNMSERIAEAFRLGTPIDRAIEKAVRREVPLPTSKTRSAPKSVKKPRAK